MRTVREQLKGDKKWWVIRRKNPNQSSSSYTVLGRGGGEIPYQKKRWQSCDKTESYPQDKVLTSLQSGHGLLVRPWLLWRTDRQWKGTPILSLSILRRQWPGAMHGNRLFKTEIPLRAKNRNNHNSGSLNLIPHNSQVRDGIDVGKLKQMRSSALTIKCIGNGDPILGAQEWMSSTTR